MNSVENLTKTLFSLRPIEEKIEIKRVGRPTSDLSSFNQSVKSGNRIFNRKFKTELYKKYTSLCGCDTKITLFCFPCILFRGEETWTKTGFKDLNQFNDRTKNHEASGTHIKNSLQLATTNIAEQLDTAYRRNIVAHNEQVKQNTYVLSIIINCIHFCGVFELALRGHDELKESNK